MALEAGLVSPQTLVDSKSPMRYGRFTIRDFHNYGARLTVEDVLVKSSNIGAAHIGMIARRRPPAGVLQADRPPRRLAGRARRRPARTAPLLPPRWTDLSTITISYGHGMAVTPLHLAAGYAALVNGGLRVHPSIVASDARPTEADRVISPRTSRELRDMMRQVVVRGTARSADVEGYEVGGKTGTADKPNAWGGYARDKTIATFASFFPASAPKYVLVVMLDEPTAVINKTSFRTAGLTAAPVLGHAIRRLAPVMGLRPLGAPRRRRAAALHARRKRIAGWPRGAPLGRAR